MYFISIASSYDRVQSGLVLFSSLYCIDFIHRIPRYSKVVKNFIRLYLYKASSDRFEKKTHSITFSRYWVLVYITFAHWRTDIFQKVFFFLLYQEYICILVYTYLDYFSNFTSLWPKLVCLFFFFGNRYATRNRLSSFVLVF